MILDQLINQNDLTSTEKDIANYILEHMHEFQELTLRKLAEKTFVSPPTITRLCKKLGMKSYTSFKVKVIEEYTASNKKIKQVDINFPFGPNDDQEDIISNLADISMRAIESAKENFDYDTVNLVVKEMIRTKNIDIYASGMSQKVAGSFVEKMNRIGYLTQIFQDESLMTYRAAASTDKQFAIVISYSGMTRRAAKNLEILSKTKTKTLLITGNRLSPFIQKADYVYYMDMGESLFMQHKMDVFAELIMLHFILDSIFAILFSMDYGKNISKTKQVRDNQFVY